MESINIILDNYSYKDFVTENNDTVIEVVLLQLFLKMLYIFVVDGDLVFDNHMERLIVKMDKTITEEVKVHTHMATINFRVIGKLILEVEEDHGVSNALIVDLNHLVSVISKSVVVTISFNAHLKDLH